MQLLRGDLRELMFRNQGSGRETIIRCERQGEMKVFFGGMERAYYGAEGLEYGMDRIIQLKSLEEMLLNYEPPKKEDPRAEMPEPAPPITEEITDDGSIVTIEQKED